jgi:threonine dehydratase
MQNTGSFKIRGMAHAFSRLPPTVEGVVTMSAGNAGRSFSYLANELNIENYVCMPNTVPRDRVETLKRMGSTVVQCDSMQLKETVQGLVTSKNLHLVHPFDDRDLICGHSSCGFEVLSECKDVDVVVVCTGGGGLVAGIAAAIKQSGSSAKVIAVEPEGAPGLYRSRAEGRAVTLDSVNTIAHGLAPPFAGHHCHMHAEAFVDDIVLVSDAEIVRATKLLYDMGIVSETSGAAAVAALMCGKISHAAGDNVVCIVSGGNITPGDLAAVLE